jgi:acyl dehydratase
MTQPITTPDAGGRTLPAGEYWYEDLMPGDHYATAGVTVTEAHVVGFAGLVGDLFDVHMDEEFARAQGFPGRIAHGLLGLSMADGLKTRCPVRLMGLSAGRGLFARRSSSATASTRGSRCTPCA